MATQSHILITPKGQELQAQLLRENLYDLPTITSQRAFLSPQRVKSPHSTSAASKLPPYFFPYRAGYFIPKAPDSPAEKSLCQEEHVYPNYLKRNAKEYPPKHVCVWKPKSTLEGKAGTTNMPQETPNGKYVHHSIYNETLTKLTGSPRVEDMNSTVYGKGIAIPMNLTSGDFKSWRDIAGIKREKEMEGDLAKSQMIMSQSNFFKSEKLGSSAGFNSKYRSTMSDWKNKEERIKNKHWEREKDYQKLLIKFDEEARRKMNAYQENQTEAPEFQKKLKSEHKTLDELTSMETNENNRYTTRIKKLQKQRYEDFWQTHDGFFDKTCATYANKERERYKAYKGHLLPTSLNGLKNRKLSEAAPKFDKKVSIAPEAESKITKDEKELQSRNASGNEQRRKKLSSFN